MEAAAELPLQCKQAAPRLLSFEDMTMAQSCLHDTLRMFKLVPAGTRLAARWSFTLSWSAQDPADAVYIRERCRSAPSAELNTV